MFSKHANTNSFALTSDELTGFLKSNREPKDYKGWYVLSVPLFHSFIDIIVVKKFL